MTRRGLIQSVLVAGLLTLISIPLYLANHRARDESATQTSSVGGSRNDEVPSLFDATTMQLQKSEPLFASLPPAH